MKRKEHSPPDLWISAYLGPRKDEILRASLASLDESRRSGEKRAVSEVKLGLFQLLWKVLIEQDSFDQQDVAECVRLLRLNPPADFPMTFFSEIAAFEEAVVDRVRQVTNLSASTFVEMVTSLGRRRHRLVSMVVKDIWAPTKCILESGARGYCLMDDLGKIIHANAKMEQLLGDDSLRGQFLTDFFKGGDKRVVQATIAGKREPLIQSIRIFPKGGNIVQVGAEIGPMLIEGTKTGNYACFIDITQSARTELEVLRQSPVGVVKVNLEGEINYANRKMLEMIGVDSYQGKKIKDIFNKSNLAKVNQQLKKRRLGESGEYETFLTRSDGHLIPVMISAVPEWDLSGKVSGSVAVVRSLEIERCVDQIHKVIERGADYQEMLQVVAETTATMVPYDLFMVHNFSTSGRHVRQLFTYSPEGGEPHWGIRWWEAPNEVIRDMQQQKTVHRIDDLNEYFSQEVWKKSRYWQQISEFLEKGYRSRLLFPVVREGRIIGAIGLYSKAEKPYSTKQEAILRSLPLDKVVIMVLSLIEKKDLKFRLDLMKKISMVREKFQDVGQFIVEGIADHYALDIVYLFMVDDNRRLFRLMCQAGANKLPDDYTQSLQEGILSLVYRKNKNLEIGKNYDFNIPNVWKNRVAKEIFKPIYNTVSKICLPIRTEEAFWILNIEDPRENAFSEEEFEALQLVRDEITSFFSRSWLYHSLETTLNITSDAIISTDRSGNIKRVNPAACHLLGYAKEDLICKNLKRYFKDQETSEEALKEVNFPNREVVWQRRDGGDLRVLLSGLELPREFAQRIFIAKDLSLQKKLEELEYLGKLSTELAMQIKTPLSLMFSWMNRLKAQAADLAAAEPFDKTIRQLKKVELTCDRLAFLGYGASVSMIPFTAMSLDVQEIIRRLQEDLPRSELDRIDFKVQEKLPLFQGSLEQLVFSLETMISYLLRFLPEEELVEVAFSLRKHQMVIDIRGVFPEEALKGPASLTDIALGTNIIRQLIEADHKGRFCHRLDQEKQVLHFYIGLPLTVGEGHG
ncbi:MAG: PAS domain S-box protein [Syntrophales bacterium]|nr:PAS domain S-box protein [Syntrophales bacterium]